MAVVRAEHLPDWYIEESLPRLRRLDELAPLCAFEKWPIELNEEQRAARREWYVLMDEQTRAEVSVGL